MVDVEPSVEDEPLVEVDPFVEAEPLVELVPVASVDWDALPEADWSPVVVVALWPEVWSPVDVEAEELTDWSPVVVVLSIVTLERPRRSMLGLTVDEDPFTAVSWSVVEPVIEELCEVEEPVTEGLAVALPEACKSVAAEPFTEADGLLVEADGLLTVAPVAALVPDWAEAAGSGMQSWWTGLAEFSFAMPVSLSASLPAFGWFSSLQRGLALAVASVDALGLLVEVFALSVNWAHAGAVPRSAASVRVLR